MLPYNNAAEVITCHTDRTNSFTDFAVKIYKNIDGNSRIFILSRLVVTLPAELENSVKTNSFPKWSSSATFVVTFPSCAQIKPKPPKSALHVEAIKKETVKDRSITWRVNAWGAFTCSCSVLNSAHPWGSCDLRDAWEGGGERWKVHMGTVVFVPLSHFRQIGPKRLNGFWQQDRYCRCAPRSRLSCFTLPDTKWRMASHNNSSRRGTLWKEWDS